MDFNFPFAVPYGIQVQLMTHIYESLSGSKVTVVESPTGTVRRPDLTSQLSSRTKANTGKVPLDHLRVTYIPRRRVGPLTRRARRVDPSRGRQDCGRRARLGRGAGDREAAQGSREAGEGARGATRGHPAKGSRGGRQQEEETASNYVICSYRAVTDAYVEMVEIRSRCCEDSDPR